MKEEIRKLEKIEGLTEFKILTIINEKYEDSEELYEDINAEKLAFNLYELGIENINKKSFYVYEEYLFYWKKRMDETKSPIFKVVYSLMLLKFSKKSLESKINKLEIADICINSLIEIVKDKKIRQGFNLTEKIKCALKIAIKYSLLEKYGDLIKENIIDLEKYLVSKNESKGFSLEIMKSQKKLKFDKYKEKQLVAILEKYYQNQANDKNKNCYASRTLILNLIKYYENINPIISKNMLISLIYSIKKDKSELDYFKIIMIEETIDICYKYKIDDEYINILKSKIEKISKNSLESMKLIKKENNITVDLLNKFIEYIVNSNSEEMFIKLSFNFIPNIDLIETQLKRMADNKYTYINFDEYLIKAYSKELMVQNFVFLSPVFNIMRENKLLNLEDIILFLEKSPLFKDVKFLLRKGIELYISGDIMSSIHILLPQIEKSFRNLIKLKGGDILEYNDYQGWDYINLTKSLNNQIICSIFSENIQNYFIILLNDKRGWNIRNRVIHGLINENYFSYVILDRLFHILLILGCFRE